MWTLTSLKEIGEQIGNNFVPGVLYGIISAVLVNLFRFRPRIYICEQVAKYGDNKYKIKIINKSFFDAYNISGYVTYYDSDSKSDFVTALTTIPLLEGKRWFKDSSNEFVTSLNPCTQIPKEKIETLHPDSILRKKYEHKTLTIEDFKVDNKINIEVSLSATHSKSGIKKVFSKSIKEICKGEWQSGEQKLKMVPREKK